MSGDMMASVYDVDGVQADIFGKGLHVRLRTDIGSLSVPAPIQYLRTAGYSTIGSGGALYKRVGSAPAHAFKAQSADGAYWAVADTTITPLMIGAVGDGVTNDTIAIQNTLAALGYYRHVVIPGMSFLVDCGLVVTNFANGCKLQLDNPIFLVRDTGASTTLRDGITSGKIALYFNNVSNFEFVGAFSLIGQGTVGATTLAGIVYEKCSFFQATALGYYDSLAAGRFALWATRGVFGDMICVNMNGKQTFDSPTDSAGTADAVVGCYESIFGRISSILNYKPVRYLSVSQDEHGQSIDNVRCHFGYIVATAASSSLESSVCSIRSAVDCHFEGGSGSGFSMGFYLIRYDTDGAWSISGNTIGSIAGVYVSTGASADAAVAIYAASGMTIGHTTINSINVTAAGEFGCLLQAGTTSVGSMIVSGGAQRSLYLTTCTVSIGYFESVGQELQSIVVGQGVDLFIDTTKISSGPLIAQTAAITYNTSFGGVGGHGKFKFNYVQYTKGGAPNDYGYVFADLTDGFDSSYIGHIDGIGSVSQCLFGGADAFLVKRGMYHSSAPPTAGLYPQRSIVWNSAVTAGSTPGWMCVSSGSPGAWKAMANIAP